MNKPKYTPGPWTCQHTGDHKRYVIGDGQSAWGTHVAEVYSDDTDRNEASANAKLITAAPELLKALQELVNTINALKLDRAGWDEMDAARYAITKATQ